MRRNWNRTTGRVLVQFDTLGGASVLASRLVSSLAPPDCITVTEPHPLRKAGFRASLLTLNLSRVGQCELRGRAVGMLTRHHLIPRTRHANKRNQREFDRTEVKRRIAWLCRLCHSHVHALFTEKQLERELNTIASLAAHPDVAGFVAWIRSRPAHFRPVSHASNSKREAGRRQARF